MSEIKQTFTASDGTSFDTEEAARNHNDLVAAEREFNLAWNKLSLIAKESFSTADGFPFVDAERGFFRERCYLVQGTHSLYPSILEVSMYPSSIRSIEVTKQGVCVCLDFYNGRDHSDIWFYLNSLYKQKYNANKRVIEILKQNIQILETQINELENKNKR